MSAKLSVNQILEKARSHVNKGEIIEAQKLYQGIFINYSKQAQDVQKKLADSNISKQKNITQDLPKETTNQLQNLYNNGDFSAVIEKTKVLLLQFPEKLVLWNALGASYLQKEMIDQAVFAFDKVLSINPNYSEAYANLGVALVKQNKLDEAVEVYNKAILLKPDYAIAYNNLGNVLKDQKQIELAIKEYRSAINLKPDFALAHWNLSLALLSIGQFEEGFKEMTWRWKWSGFPSIERKFKEPKLDISTDLNIIIKPIKLYIYPEQGLGDTN